MYTQWAFTYVAKKHFYADPVCYNTVQSPHMDTSYSHTCSPFKTFNWIHFLYSPKVLTQTELRFLDVTFR